MPKRAESAKKLPAYDLKGKRESKGYSQAEAADILCTTQASVARWEASGAVPEIYRKYWDLYHKVHKSASRKTMRRAAKKAADVEES